VYPVIVEPFVTAPLKVMVALASPAVAEIAVGAEAGPCGINGEETIEASESPTILVATAVKV
jgi:hypothetical protein